jgi:hypothetical protein
MFSVYLLVDTTILNELVNYLLSLQQPIGRGHGGGSVIATLNVGWVRQELNADPHSEHPSKLPVLLHQTPHLGAGISAVYLPFALQPRGHPSPTTSGQLSPMVSSLGLSKHHSPYLKCFPFSSLLFKFFKD